MSSFNTFPVTLSAEEVAQEMERLSNPAGATRIENPEGRRHRAVVTMLARWHEHNGWTRPGATRPGAELPGWKPRPRKFGKHRPDVDAEKVGWLRIIEVEHANHAATPHAKSQLESFSRSAAARGRASVIVAWILDDGSARVVMHY